MTNAFITNWAEALSARMMPIMESHQARLLAEVSAQDRDLFYSVIDDIETASKVPEET